jgi:hypothetical protein
MGPSASKVYRKDRGVAFGGYGEVIYQNYDARNDAGAPSGERDQIDMLEPFSTPATSSTTSG